MNDAKTMRTELLRNPNFRWLMGGGILSMLGDQFTLIALPWLVLQMTGSSLALGLILALLGVPRAIFILVGGAVVDRFSPSRVLMITKYVNAALLGLLTALFFSGVLSLAVLSVLALGLGLASAFAIPSGTSLQPQVVEAGQLQMANGISMGMRQITMLAGPLLAGLLIAVAGNGTDATMPDGRGIGLAFAFDCFSFIVSAWTLSKVRLRPRAPVDMQQSVFAAIGAGLQMVWQDVALRTCFMYWALVSFFIGGSMQVALPLLVNTRLPSGAAALGLLMGAHGTGSLAGMLASGLSRKLRFANFGVTLLCIDILVGMLLIPLGGIVATWQGAVLLFAVGMLAGFIQIGVFSWIQTRVPVAMMGRTMSIFMFIFMGLAPLSAAATGWLLERISLGQLFAGSGIFLICAALFALAFTPMRTITVNQ